MDMVSLIIVLIVIGAIIYVVGLLPIDATFKTIIKVVAIVVLAIGRIRALAPALHL